MGDNQHKHLLKELNKYGIKSEADLDRELKKLKPLNIGVMTTGLKENKELSEVIK